MIRECSEPDRGTLRAFLNEKPVYHTFILSDLEMYGFDKDFQAIYMQEEQESCIGVFLRYFHNLILAGDTQKLDHEGVCRLVGREITTIMGKAEIVETVTRYLGRLTKLTYNNLYIHKGVTEAKCDIGEVRLADLDDVDRIYRFLMEFPEFKDLYSDKKMLDNRMKSGEGIHLLIERDGEIIAHGNSAASADLTCMMGGICVKEEYRRRGYAKKILQALSGEIHKQKKLPCIFSPANQEHSIFSELGFEIYGNWGVAQLI